MIYKYNSFTFCTTHLHKYLAAAFHKILNSYSSYHIHMHVYDIATYVVK